jgi:hypothetical protein
MSVYEFAVLTWRKQAMYVATYAPWWKQVVWCRGVGFAVCKFACMKPAEARVGSFSDNAIGIAPAT